MTPAELIQQYLKIDDYLTGEAKRFAEFCRPYKLKQAELENKLLEILQNGTSSVRTDFGTAYLSTITTPSIIDRDAFLDAVMDNYNTWGAGMLQLGKPKKEAIDDYWKENNGKLPPGVETTSFTRVNVRRSS